MNEKTIVVYGDPINGLTFFGPFDSLDDAHDFASQDREHDWWLAPLVSPSEGDG